jgi:eukaryotic-like serine/threonine-protein kinase
MSVYKAPQTRPSPANFRARLERHQAKIELSAGLAQLQEADHAEVQRRAEAARQQSQVRTESERRADLAASTVRGFARISDQLSADITASAPSAALSTSRSGGWTLRLHTATLTLTLSGVSGEHGASWGGWTAPPFDIVGVASVNLRVPADRWGYEGRSNSL